MARLNEPQPPAESVESLKRRFIRQNRDIAKRNSTQSQQIRALEGEVTRLLTENLALRQNNLELKHNLEKREGDFALQNVAIVRKRLEDKVTDLNLLLGELQIAENTRRTVDEKPKQESNKLLKRSLNIRDFSNPVEITELGRLEGRLPPILEDKSYPRKSLALDDINITSLCNTNNHTSPDLGPPPSSCFEEIDPVKRDINNPEIQKEGPLYVNFEQDENSDVTVQLFANLETRRRRRGSGSSRDVEYAQPAEEFRPSEFFEIIQEPTKSPFKAGSKRKLAARDNEETKFYGDSCPGDEFTFSRRSMMQKSSACEMLDRKQNTETTQGADLIPQRERAATVLPIRKALSDKPVNLDPVLSPSKSRQRSVEKSNKPKAQEPKKNTVRSTRGAGAQQASKPLITKIVSNRVSSEPETVEIPSTGLAPVTPATENLALFSPGSSAPSTTDIASRDTPPPAELAMGSTGRASRRRVASVSYAEPNLRDKMRRPGKELVNAVTDSKPIKMSLQRSFNGELKEEPGPGEARNETEGAYQGQSKVWKPSSGLEVPPSPLGNKSASSSTAQPKLNLSMVNSTEQYRRISASQQVHKEDTSFADTTQAITNMQRLNGSRNMGKDAEHGPESAQQGPYVSHCENELSTSSKERNSNELSQKTLRTANIGSGENIAKNDGIVVRHVRGSRGAKRRETLNNECKEVNNSLSELQTSENDMTTSLRAGRADRRRSMMV